jgi:tRNA uridine 5-carbamoylmethylation protein Kti12
MTREELTEQGWEQYLNNRPLRNEMDDFIQTDEDMIIMVDKTEYLKTVIYQLEQIIKSINSRTWDIKSSIDWAKFTNGGM